MKKSEEMTALLSDLANMTTFSDLSQCTANILKTIANCLPVIFLIRTDCS